MLRKLFQSTADRRFARILDNELRNQRNARILKIVPIVRKACRAA